MEFKRKKKVAKKKEKVVMMINLVFQLYCPKERGKINQHYDVTGRSTFLVRKNYTYSGNDFTTGTQYGVFGEVLEQCDPNKGGCDMYEYTLSPLRRLVKMTPAGSSKPILHNVSSNDIGVSIGQELNYSGNTLVKNRIIDENGVASETFINMRGQTVMTSRDPEGLNLKTYYLYNKRGSILETFPPGSTNSADDLNFIYTYYINGMLKSKRIPDEGIYNYTYNSREAVETVIKPNGYTTAFTYHGTYPDFLTTITENNNPVKTISAYQNNYELGWIGEVSLRTDQGAMLSTVYSSRDDIGRVLEETREYLNGSSDFQYKYDHADNVRIVSRHHTGPTLNKVIGYTYKYDMPIGVRINEVELDLGGLTSLSKYVYDDNDWLQTDVVGDGLHTISYDYHPRGWLREINSVEPPPPGPLEECDEIDDNDVPVPHPPFIDCKRGSNYYWIRLLYNCDAISSGDTTNIHVTMLGPEGTNYNRILLNGSVGVENSWSDSLVFQFGTNELNDLKGLLWQLLADCLPDSVSSMGSQYGLGGMVNQILDDFDEESSGDLFGIKIHYDDGKSNLDAPSQYNGNISWLDWRIAGEHYQSYGFQYDAANRLTQGAYEAKYTKCKKTPADYNVSYSYDPRGNLLSLHRNGSKGISQDGTPLYGLIDQLSYSYSGTNQLDVVEDGSDHDRGFVGDDSQYIYQNGRLIQEIGARNAMISYNFLNQPTLIKVSAKDAVRNTWDAEGALQKQILYDANETVLHERLYHDGIEYLDGKIQSIHHPQGRYVFEYESDGTTLKRTYHEFMITDHLGNVRVRFADLNGDKKININDEGPGQEKELLGSNHYYPYGLKMEGIFHNQSGPECRYQYNGIEHLSHANLNVSLATWRTHDPAIGRWWQVDPYAGSFYSLSPYCSMGNNPISITDPDGDFIHIVIGAAIGGIANLIYQGVSGNIGSVGDGLAAFGIGAGAGALGAATGGASLAAIGTTSSLGGAILAGATSGAVGGAAAGFVQNTGNALYFQNSNLGDALGSGLEGAAWGALGGAVTGGIAGGIAYTPNNLPGGPPNKFVGPSGELLETYSTHNVSGGGYIVKQGASITDGLTFSDDFIVTANRLPFARSGINGLQVANPAGSSISLSIPENYVAIATRNGKGIIYGPQGVSHNNMANAIRVHLNPTSYAPNGYAVFYNSAGIPYDPNTGRTLGKALWHFLLP